MSDNKFERLWGGIRSNNHLLLLTTLLKSRANISFLKKVWCAYITFFLMFRTVYVYYEHFTLVW